MPLRLSCVYVEVTGRRNRAAQEEDSDVDDIKRTYREGEETAKETWRKSDGDESVADAIGNAGDDIRKELGNVGDDMRRNQQEDLDQDKAAWRRSDGDESIADKVGNAGDDVRREVGER